MPEYTDDYGLIKLVNDPLSSDNYRFTNGNIDVIARLLRLGAETHRHTGAASTLVDSGADTSNWTLSLTRAGDAGVIPGGVRSYYCFTIVVDGFESTPSSVFYVDTPVPVASPAAPSLVTAATGGSLSPGDYYYMLSAYTDSNTLETRALNATHVRVPAGTDTNTVTVSMPTLPTGATGFNIYRKRPHEVRYTYVASTVSSTYVDTGAAGNSNRTTAARNLTSAQNRVLVQRAGATPMPSGAVWRLYRTYAEGDWVNSKIAELADTATEFNDLGAYGSGSPPMTGLEVGSPTKIDLSDGAEVQGQLPLDMLESLASTDTTTVLFGDGWRAPDSGDVAFDDAGLEHAVGPNVQLAVESLDRAVMEAQISHQELGPWFQDNVAASQTDVVLGYLGRPYHMVLRTGLVTSILIRSSEARMAGTCTVEVLVNDTPTGLMASLDASSLTQTLVAASDGATPLGATPFPGSGVNVYPGDRISITVTTDASWDPTTADIDVAVGLATTAT
jgi:hypothetical protein